MEQVITLATFNERPSAETLKDRLIGAGLHAEVVDDSAAQAALFVNGNPKAYMHVRVHKEEVEQAEQLLRDWEPEGVMSLAVRCPQCGSSRIEYPQFSRRTAGSIPFAALAALKVIPREYFCQSCQFTWPDKVEEEVERDALNWPKAKS